MPKGPKRSRGAALERTWRLWTRLAECGGPLTSAELAEWLGAQERTVRRDLEVLRRLGVMVGTERVGRSVLYSVTFGRPPRAAAEPEDDGGRWLRVWVRGRHRKELRRLIDRGRGRTLGDAVRWLLERSSRLARPVGGPRSKVELTRSRARVREALRRFDAGGATVGEVARLLECEPLTAWKFLVRQERNPAAPPVIAPPKPKRSDPHAAELDPELVQRALSLRLEGRRIADVGAVLGCSQRRVRQMLDSAGGDPIVRARSIR